MTSDNEKMLEDDLLKEIIDEFKSISESQDGIVTYKQVYTFETFKEMEDETEKTKILANLNTYLTQDRDRKLFDLPSIEEN